MMYKIAVSIQYIKGQIRFTQRNNRKKAIYTICVLWVVIFAAMETFMYTVEWWTIGDSRYFMAVTLTLLSLIYLSTMLNTFQKTKLLGADSLRAEERALLRQFTVFCGCYALEAIFEFSINTL